MDSRDDISKLEPETHRLAAFVADRIVGDLDQHRIAANVGDVRSIEAVAVQNRSKNLGHDPGEVIRKRSQRFRDLREYFSQSRAGSIGITPSSSMSAGI